MGGIASLTNSCLISFMNGCGSCFGRVGEGSGDGLDGEASIGLAGVGVEDVAA